MAATSKAKSLPPSPLRGAAAEIASVVGAASICSGGAAFVVPLTPPVPNLTGTKDNDEEDDEDDDDDDVEYRKRLGDDEDDDTASVNLGDYPVQTWLEVVGVVGVPTIGVAILAVTHPVFFLAGASLSLLGAYGGYNLYNMGYCNDESKQRKGPNSTTTAITSASSLRDQHDPGPVRVVTASTSQSTSAPRAPPSRSSPISCVPMKEVALVDSLLSEEDYHNYHHPVRTSSTKSLTTDFDDDDEDDGTLSNYPDNDAANTTSTMAPLDGPCRIPCPLKKMVLPPTHFTSLHAKDFFKIFFSDDAPFCFSRFQQGRGDINVHYGTWQDNDKACCLPSPKQGDGNNSPSRTISFQTPTKSPFGPSHAKATTVQTLACRSKSCIVMESVTSIQDIPFSNCFTVQELWILQSTVEKIVTVRVSAQVNFSKSCPFEGQIRQRAISSLEENLKAWCAMARRAIEISQKRQREAQEKQEQEKRQRRQQEQQRRRQDRRRKKLVDDENIEVEYRQETKGDVVWVAGDKNEIQMTVCTRSVHDDDDKNNNNNDKNHQEDYWEMDPMSFSSLSSSSPRSLTSGGSRRGRNKMGVLRQSLSRFRRNKKQ